MSTWICYYCWVDGSEAKARLKKLGVVVRQTTPSIEFPLPSGIFHLRQDRLIVREILCYGCVGLAQLCDGRSVKGMTG